MMSSKKDGEIWKNKCINPFQKKKHKEITLRRVSDNLRVKFSNLREDSQVCNTCRFELINLKGRSFLNNQATISTVVIYYKDGGELKHRSIAIIFDNLPHDTVAAHEYQKIIINYLIN